VKRRSLGSLQSAALDFEKHEECRVGMAARSGSLPPGQGRGLALAVPGRRRRLHGVVCLGVELGEPVGKTALGAGRGVGLRCVMPDVIKAARPSAF